MSKEAYSHNVMSIKGHSCLVEVYAQCLHLDLAIALVILVKSSSNLPFLPASLSASLPPSLPSLPLFLLPYILFI